MDRKGANEVLKALTVLWPMRYPETMSEEKARATIDVIEEIFIDFAGDTIIKACRNLAKTTSGIPDWAAIRAEAETIKAEHYKKPSTKRPTKLATDPQGWLYVFYEDGDQDWIYDGNHHKWRSESWQIWAEKVLNLPSMEGWTRRYFPKWANANLVNRYKDEIERQERMNF